MTASMISVADRFRRFETLKIPEELKKTSDKTLPF